MSRYFLLHVYYSSCVVLVLTMIDYLMPLVTRRPQHSLMPLDLGLGGSEVRIGLKFKSSQKKKKKKKNKKDKKQKSLLFFMGGYNLKKYIQCNSLTHPPPPPLPIQVPDPMLP
jgi:hypothetical protein